MSTQLLMIDNYDSFTYNLVQYIGELGTDVKVLRNDMVSLAEIKALKPEKIMVSPGPCTPKEAGISCEVISNFGESTPILGVCLGHQCIGHVYGGNVIRADRIMHGKTSIIHHNEKGVFKNIPNPFEAIRYHSLIVENSSFPAELEITAYTTDDEIMALRHKTFPVYGVQFHPESILTKYGKQLIKNFLDL